MLLIDFDNKRIAGSATAGEILRKGLIRASKEYGIRGSNSESD